VARDLQIGVDLDAPAVQATVRVGTVSPVDSVTESARTL
jgi:hypothetical protein